MRYRLSETLEENGPTAFPDRVYGGVPMSGGALHKIQVQRLIDIRVVSGKKKRSGNCKCV
jgi:hypothetical protein